MTKANKHRLIPEHTKLSEEEKKKVLEEHNIKVNQLPIIFVDDPAIKDLGAVPGDVIKITRHSKTAGEAVFYRGVANG